jgi:hypothetical protein
LGMWFDLADGTREWLTDSEVSAVTDALWSSNEKGAVSIAGKMADERRRARVLQAGVKLRESEGDVFRRALGHVRHAVNTR